MIEFYLRSYLLVRDLTITIACTSISVSNICIIFGSIPILVSSFWSHASTFSLSYSELTCFILELRGRGIIPVSVRTEEWGYGKINNWDDKAASRKVIWQKVYIYGLNCSSKTSELSFNKPLLLASLLNTLGKPLIVWSQS